MYPCSVVLEVFEELLCGHVLIERVRIFDSLVPFTVDDGHDEVETFSVGCIVERSV